MSSGSPTQEEQFSTNYPTVEEQRKTVQSLLEHKLGAEHISVRPGAGGTKFVYVESWKVIELANSIFGYNGWSSSIVDVTPDFIDTLPGKKFRVGITAVVRVTVRAGSTSTETAFHEDVGYGIAENKNKGIAIENAKKEAVSDARKRALRCFGNALGNCIYDKNHIKKVKSVKRQSSAVSSSVVTFDKLRAHKRPKLNPSIVVKPELKQENQENQENQTQLTKQTTMNKTTTTTQQQQNIYQQMAMKRNNLNK